MKKTFVKGSLKLIILALFTVLFMAVASDVLRVHRDEAPDDTYQKVRGYYALEQDKMDIISFGTSHAYYGINPGILYHETGLNNYVYAGECQPIEVTVYYLKEALKTQKPKLVILDIFGMSETSKGCRSEGIYRVNIEEMKWSLNKAEAYTTLPDQSVLGNMFDVSLYHNQWSQLNMKRIAQAYATPFNPSFGATLGFNASNENKGVMASAYTEKAKRPENFEAFEEFLDICNENDIKVLIIKTPCYLEEQDKPYYRYVFDYCEEQGIDHIDFNMLKEELDYVHDRDGDIWHATVFGARKINEYLGTYIKTNYGIEPYDTELYKDEMEALYTRSVYECLLQAMTTDQMMQTARDFDVLTIVTYKHEDDLTLSDENIEVLKKMNIEVGRDNLVVLDHGVPVYESTEEIKGYEYNGHVFDIDRNGMVVMDGQTINKGAVNVNMVVIDKHTMQKINGFCFDARNDLFGWVGE